MIRTIFKFLAGCVILFAGVLGVSFIQRKFDEGDKRKALQAILSKFSDATDCRPEILSRFRGLIRVNCRQGRWVVDVVQGAIEEDKP